MSEMYLCERGSEWGGGICVDLGTKDVEEN